MKTRQLCTLYGVLILLIGTFGADVARGAAPVIPLHRRAAPRKIISLNEGWHFARFGPMPDGSLRAEPEGIEVPSFNDSAWRTLNLPHDWGIEGPFRPELPNRTGKLPWAGIGWYRKTFVSPATDAGRNVFIEFDGAMHNAEVWLNGKPVGGWPYGYTAFQLDLTKHLKIGETNHLAVRLDNKEYSSRWYPGGGLYRRVRLIKTNPTHIAHHTLFITTPEITPTSATVRIECDTIQPQPGDQLLHEIYAPERNSAPVAQQTIAPGQPCSLQIESPQRWNLNTPALYLLKTTILRNGKPVDQTETPFGIRSIEFTTDRGFLLNGKTVPLNGVCMHHDLGPLGTAFHPQAAERQIRILQQMGCNAIRTAHNPPAPEFLDLCDRMGMLVQVEAFDCWKEEKTPNGYNLYFDDWHEKDLRAMVRHNRNHPSVIMWSTGNEVKEQWKPEIAIPLARHLTDIVQSEDPTRPVTLGCSNREGGTNGFQKAVDVFGYNYKPETYATFRKRNPDQPLYGSETASCISSRGEYFFPIPDDKSKGIGGWFQVSSHDLSAPRWAQIPDDEFAAQDQTPGILGEFVWTGFDYLGEPTPFNRDKTNLLNFSDPAERKRMKIEMEKLGAQIPPRSSYFGIVDLCGFPKDRFYLYQSRWRPEHPMAHILPHWNWPERIGKTTPVHVYTSGDEAELFLNGKSLGRKKKGPYEYRLRWDDTLYQPGTLQVVAYKNGQPWAEAQTETTGPAARIDLQADRTQLKANGTDLAFITVAITDNAGRTVPRSNPQVDFEIEGPGEIIAVGNGNPVSHESFQAHQRRAFNGLCLIVVRTHKEHPGTIQLTATADGLKGSTIQIQSK